MNLIQSPPLSLYIHLPWCVRKCPYCDFNSHATAGNSFPESAYTDALLKDLDYEQPAVGDREVSSIFIGGGTPSLFSAAALGRLLSTLRDRLVLKNELEITLEANPGTLEEGRYRAYREIGINRLSIGVQSFNDRLLRALGRVHDAGAAVRAVEAAHRSGFEQVNIDLMYGLPGQGRAEAMQDLRRGIGLGPAHLSWYQLTIEPNTVYYTHTPVLPDEDEIESMQRDGQALLADAGFHRYELSAYATAGSLCRHNLNYWEFGDYLGLGAGAHGKLTGRDGKVRRYARHRIPDAYLRLAGGAAVIRQTRVLTREDLILEFLMNALRLTRGFDVSLFTRRTGLAIDLIEQRIREAAGRGWLELQDSIIRPTPAGSDFLDDILQLFMPADAAPAPGQRPAPVGGVPAS